MRVTEIQEENDVVVVLSIRRPRYHRSSTRALDNNDLANRGHDTCPVLQVIGGLRFLQGFLHKMSFVHFSNGRKLSTESNSVDIVYNVNALLEILDSVRLNDVEIQIDHAPDLH